MTRLEAVNRILRAAGLRTVSALSTGGASDAAEAERILDERELEVQSQGWHYNTRFNVTLTPDANDYLVPDSNVIRIDTYGVDQYKDAVLVGGKLFDVENDRYTWTGSVKTTQIARHAFNCIPYPVRKYITDYAAHTYAMLRYNAGSLSAAMVSEAARQMEQSRDEANDFDAKHRNVNILTTASARRGRGELPGRMRY